MKTRQQIPPDPEEMNDDRAEWTEQALETFRRATCPGSPEEPFEDLIPDLLADLAHYCDRNGLDFGHMLWGARAHYEDETEDAGRQFARVSIMPRPLPGFKPYTCAQILDAVVGDLEAAPADLSLVDRLARKALAQHVDYVRGEGMRVSKKWNIESAARQLLKRLTKKLK